MSSTLRWRGEELRKRIAQAAVAAVTEIDQRIEAEAKKELYPGHGLITGTLRRGHVGEPGVLQGSKVRGRVAVRGVRYAKKIHKKYRQILKGLERVKPQARAILRRHAERSRRG